MNFKEALAMVQEGKQVSRAGWNGKNMYIGLQKPDANSKNSLPYLYFVTADGDRVPWVASHTDILATDWAEVEIDGADTEVEGDE